VADGELTHYGGFCEGDNPFLQAVIEEIPVCGILHPGRKTLEKSKGIFTQFIEFIILHIINTGSFEGLEKTVGGEGENALCRIHHCAFSV
jgi:hypothetical protein